MRPVLLVLCSYPAWLAMMACHETGHALHAVTSGGRVERVTIPLLDFSRTDVNPDPHPLWVAWGGPAWGCLLPLALLALSHLLHRGVSATRWFTGFCLVANGAYIGFGGWMTAGDGHDLLRHGAPLWTLVTFGTTAFAAGLYLWHRETRRLPSQ